MPHEAAEEVSMTHAEEEDAFNSAFNEAAAAADGDDYQESDDAEQGEEAGAEVLETGEEPGDSGPVIEDEATGEEESQEAVVEEEGSSESADDPYSGLSQEEVVNLLKTSVKDREDLEHQFKSNAGRINAYQRQITELQNEVRASRDRPAAPTQEQISAGMATTESWEEFKKEYPDVSAAIEAQLDVRDSALKTEMQAATAPVQALTERQAQDDLNRAWGDFESKHTNWQDLINTNEFGEWLDKQPPEVAAWADSDDPTQASSLLDYFVDHQAATGQRDPNPEPNKDPPAQVLSEKRRKQLEAGAAVPNSAAGIQPGKPADDFSSAFQAFAARKERENRSHR